MTIMRPALLTVAATALTLGTAAAETKTYDLSGFENVRASAGIDVTIEVGPDHSVELETMGDVDRALVELDGNTLVLSRKSRRGFNINIGQGENYRFTVTMPEIREASASAGTDVAITGISGGSIDLSASAGSDLDAEGSCESLSTSASAGSDVRAFGLSCANVTASASSGSSVEVTATEAVKARASSGGDVTIRGNPDRRDTSDSSGGSVRFRN